MTRIKQTAVLATALVLVAMPAAASAHVTLQPSEAPAGGFTRLDVRVPNEQDDAGTTKVDLQLPDGFPSASYEQVDGWSVRVSRERLDTPLEVEGEEVTEQVSRITWTAQGDERIGPGEFRDFGLSVRTPGEAGDTLTFKANQTYDNGDVVRWIGPAGSDEPAPQVTLTAAEEEHGAAEEEEGGEAADGAAASGEDAEDDDDDDSETLSIAALIVGGLGLVVGGAAFARGRRRP